MRFLNFFLIAICLVFLDAQAQLEQKIINCYENKFILGDRFNSELNQYLQPQNSEADQLLAKSIWVIQYFKDSTKTSIRRLDEIETKINSYKNTKIEAYYFFAKSKFYIYQKDYKAVSNNLMKAVVILEKLGDYGLASYLWLIMCDMENNYSQPMVLKGLDLAKKSNNPNYILNAHNYYVHFLKIKYEENPSQENKQKILDFLDKTKSMIPDESKITNKYFLSCFYLDYGYLSLSLKKEEIKGNQYLETAYQLGLKHKMYNVVQSYFGILGDIQKENGNWNQAKAVFQKGLDITKKHTPSDLAAMVLYYNDLRNIAKIERDWSAFEQLDAEYLKIKDLLYEKTKKSNVEIAVIANEISQRDEIIKLQKSKENLMIGLIVIASLLCIVLLVMYVLYRKNQKLRYEILSKYSEELEKEKKKAQKDLMQSMLHLEKKNEILQNIKTSVHQSTSSTQDGHKLMKLVNLGLTIDDSFEQFKDNITPIYPNFYQNLQTQAQNTLTQLDLKYCSFFLMKLSTKEIAVQMNVEPKSIRMVKYRLKQKLKLSKEQSLEEFLELSAS